MQIGVEIMVLSCRVGEKIVIGNDTVLEIVRITATKVYFSVDSSQEVSVYGKEVYDRITREMHHDIGGEG